jgi:transposase
VRDGAVTLNAAQLRLLFTGMDWTQVRAGTMASLAG